MNRESLGDDVIERLATAIHAQYLASSTQKDANAPTNVCWENLSEYAKGQNRSQARHTVEQLSHLGIAVVDAAHVGECEVIPAIPKDLVPMLARLEHDRWMHLRYIEGYRWGENRSDTGDKRHPDMVAWDDLSENAKQKDLEAIRNFPMIVSAIGFQIIRNPTA